MIGSPVTNKTIKMYIYLNKMTKRGLLVFQLANSATKIASANKNMHKKEANKQ